ncbi:MAG: prolipoprotein diacylglyceryl transferase [Gemmatimonadales bacterium]
MKLFPHPIVHHPFVYGIGSLQVTGFGIAILGCFIIAQFVAQRELARRGFDPDPIGDMIFAAVVGGLLGAKLYYVVILGNWDAILDRGGFVFWGGLIGGMIAVLAVVVRKRFGVMRIFDVGAPALAAAYAVGRTGCWAIGDDYGRPWNGWLAVAFPHGAPPSTAGMMAHDFGTTIPPGVAPSTVLAVYPTQLMEVALGLVMFAVIWRLRDHRHAEGWLFGVYCVAAGLERFTVEFFRAKDDLLSVGLTLAQFIALAFVLIGIAWMIWRWRITPGRRGIHAMPAELSPTR